MLDSFPTIRVGPLLHVVFTVSNLLGALFDTTRAQKFSQHYPMDGADQQRARIMFGPSTQKLSAILLI